MAPRSTEPPLRIVVGGLVCALAMTSCSPASRSLPAAPPARAAVAVEPHAAADRGGWSPDCRMAHDGWVEAARAAREPIAGLDECLAAEISPCDLDVAAVRSSLAELSTYDHLIRLSCGGSR